MVAVLAALVVWPASAPAQDEGFQEDFLDFDPVSQNFGEIAAGSVVSRELEVMNIGYFPITLKEVGLQSGAGGPFVISAGDCAVDLVILPDGSCKLVVTFTAPHAHGSFEATVLVEGDAGTGTTTAVVKGSSYVVPGHLVASPGEIDFGFVPWNSSSAPEIATIRNPGETAVSVILVRILGGGRRHFIVDAGPCEGARAAGSSCHVTSTFRPLSSPSATPFPWPVKTPDSTASIPVSATVELRTQNGSRLLIPLRGEAPALGEIRNRAVIDYRAVERALARLVAAVPRLTRGGPKRPLVLPAFNAPASGWLNLLVRESGGPKRRGRLASGTLEIRRGERGRLRFSLSRKARNLLRRSMRTRVKVVVAFKADTGKAFRQAAVLTVRPPKSRKPS